MRKQVYFYEARRAALADRLAETAGIVSLAGDTLQALFPGLTWDTRALWVFAFEQEAREHYCKEILKEEAEASKLPCEWDREDNTEPAPREIAGIIYNPRPEPLSEEIRVNRRFVEIRTREIREKIQALGWALYLEDYLRAGVLTIGKAGELVIAKDADARLDDFCTLYAEDKQQAAFVEGVERMQTAAAALAAAYEGTAKAMEGERWAPLLGRCAGDYDPTRLDLLAAPFNTSRMRLVGENIPARALITFFNLEREQGRPKFYNEAGVWAYTLEEAEAAARCKLKGLQIGARHPRLYRAVASSEYAAPIFCRPLESF